MNVQILRRALLEVEADCLAVGVYEDAPAVPNGGALGALVAALAAEKELAAGLGDLTPLYGVPGVAARSVLVFGLGPRAEFGPGNAFLAGVAVSRRLATRPRGTVAVGLPVTGEPGPVASALIEGLVVGTRGPGLRKSEPGRHPFGLLQLVAPPDLAEDAGAALGQAVGRGVIVGESVNFARDLVNTPPAEKAPTALAARVREAAEAAGARAEVWGLDRIRSERFGGLLGVSAGSDEPPAFVVLEHLAGGDRPTLSLVGKGITFDSGGLSLKPSASMEDMKSDMTGAAVVASVICAAARLKLPVNLRGYLAISENMTGGRAMKLGDVLTMRNGKTVEVLNTDAEGRLVLADALSFAAESAPDRMIDLATLTGACMAALGTRIAGLFSADDAFAEDVLDAGKATGERLWRLPLDDDFKPALKSHVADLKNIGGKWGGAITAARFLQEFVGEVPWVHLDIAGPSWADSETATRDAGGTGCYVRTLVTLLEAAAEAEPA